MSDPLTDPMPVMYHAIETFYDRTQSPDAADRWIWKNEDSEAARVYRSKAEALGAAGQTARSAGAPEEARVILDYDVLSLVDRVLVDWYTPGDTGQPDLLRKGRRAFESFRLQEIPR